jgi:hypothetical protein
MSPEKLSWIIALLTELRDNPGSELQVSTIGASGRGREVVWRKCEDLPKFVFPQSCYRVVKPQKYRLYRNNAGLEGMVLSRFPTLVASVEKSIELSQATWITDWLPLPEQK